MTKVKLTYNDAQEALHKMGILAVEPELQESYGLTQEQANAIVDSIPHAGGEWAIPDFAVEAVREEMENHAEILRHIASTAFKDGEVSQSLRIHKQAKKFEYILSLYLRDIPDSIDNAK